MATFIENIRKIQGEAIYGPEMRGAIAQAIQQVLGLDIDGNDGIVFLFLTPIENEPDDYMLTFQVGYTETT